MSRQRFLGLSILSRCAGMTSLLGPPFLRWLAKKNKIGFRVYYFIGSVGGWLEAAVVGWAEKGRERTIKLTGMARENWEHAKGGRKE